MKKWSEILEENKDDVMQNMVDAFKQAEGGMSGWHVGVEIDQAGNIWTTGILSQGSQSESSWKGETFIIDWISTWNVDYEEENFLDDADYAYLKDEFEQYKKDNDDEYLILREWMINNHSDILENWDRIAKEVEVDGYYDNVQDKLDQIIENQKEYESYKCEDAEFKSF